MKQSKQQKVLPKKFSFHGNEMLRWPRGVGSLCFTFLVT